MLGQRLELVSRFSQNDDAHAKTMWLTRLTARNRGKVLVVGAIVTAVAVFGARHLELRTNLADLLPSTSSSAADYKTFLSVFGGLEKVFVIIRQPPDSVDSRTVPLSEAAITLASLLSEGPEVASVRAGVLPEDEEFFLRSVLPRAPLLIGHDWREILEVALRPDALKRRAETLRLKILAPTSALDIPMMEADPLGFSSHIEGFQFLASSIPIDPASLTFLSPSGEAALVIVTPARSEIDPAGGRALRRDLEAAFKRVRGEYGVDFRFDAVGGPLYAVADEEIIRNDLKRTVSGSALGCTALLVAAFGGVAFPGILFLTVLVALIITGGIVGGIFHGISAIALGFAAVLIGLGIDYGIHAATRYRECRLGGHSREASLEAIFRVAGPGILTSALTTAAAFSVLSFAHLRPVRELGVVVSLGIISMFVVTMTMGAAALGFWNGRGKRAENEGVLWRWAGRLVDGCVGVGRRHPSGVLLTSIGTVLVLATGIPKIQFDSDLGAIRPVNHPALEAERLLEEQFGVTSGTVTCVVPGSDLNDALYSCKKVSDILRAELGDQAEITSPLNWFGEPDESRRRLAALQKKSLEDSVSRFEFELVNAGLNPKGFSAGLDAIRALDQGRDPAPVDQAEWPIWMREFVKVDHDAVWAMVRVRLPSDVWPDGPPSAIVSQIKSAVPGVAVASVAAVGRDLEVLAKKDLRQLSWLALGMVLLVVLISFRGNITDSLVALTPVALGSVSLLGVWGIVGCPIDLVTLIVLPILLGIGIDDGLHAVHGTRRMPPRSLAESVSESGRAMTLTTLTTCVGFGSLTLSHVPGLRSGGILIFGGVAACLIATLLVLPALGEAMKKTRAR